MSWISRKVKMGRFLEMITPPCKDVTRMMSEAMDRPLPLRKRVAVYVHRLICVWCDRYCRHLRMTRDWSKKFKLHLEDVSNDKLPSIVKAKIKLAMHRENK
jgi:hypothetical protein